MNLLIRAANIYTPTLLKRKKLLELFACTAGGFECEVPSVQGLPYDELLRSYAQFTAAQANRALCRDNAVIAHEEPATLPDFCGAASPQVSASDVREAIPSPGHAERPPYAPLHAAEQQRSISASPSQHETASSRPRPAPPADRCEPSPALTPAPGGSVLPEIEHRLYNGAYRIGCDLRRTFRITNTADALAAARVLYRALGIDLQATPAGEITVRGCFFSEFYSGPVCQVIASLDEGLFAGLSGGGRLAFTQRITEGRDCCKAEFRPLTSRDRLP